MQAVILLYVKVNTSGLCITFGKELLKLILYLSESANILNSILVIWEKKKKQQKNKVKTSKPSLW